jgi:hypothetical protein
VEKHEPRGELWISGRVSSFSTLVTPVSSNTNPVVNSGGQEELAVLATLVTPVWSNTNPVVNSRAQEELAVPATLVTPVWTKFSSVNMINIKLI